MLVADRARLVAEAFGELIDGEDRPVAIEEQHVQ
jgi:hypothetical protein